ncbi:hypothetical protein [Corynebacterium qintianiae]|uniref:hypothetical protein n=1 Tax=Corynebacterium qintianiae TaxID=2709392 RepID=UPI0013EAFE4A|nr:hypothetical protein [Corynebacterium qintianiae]
MFESHGAEILYIHRLVFALCFPFDHLIAHPPHVVYRQSTDAGGTLALRRTIDQADLPTTELDEYRLKLHLEAREDGLRGAVALSILLFVVAGAIAFALRFWVWDGPTVALLFAKMAHLQLVWIPFIVARSLAGKFNRDELVSAR